MTAPDVAERHREIAELLPWFVNGTLDADLHDRVERHLAQCPECREDVGVLRQIAESVRRESPAPLLPPADPRGLLERIDGRPASPRPARPARRGPLIASAALAAVLGAVFVAASLYDAAAPPARYETVTAADEAGAIRYIFEVRFAAGVDDRRARQVLDDIGVTEVVERLAAGRLRVVVQLPDASLGLLQEFMAEAGTRAEIESLDVVSAQRRAE